MPMVIVNFSHPFTTDQIAQLVELLHQPVEREIEVTTQFDHGRPFGEQARALVDAVGLTSEEWQTLPLLVNLPSLNVISALVLAELHGRTGYFLSVIRLRPVEGSMPPRFEVAEMVNLQAAREGARTLR